jgi:hypothetical protein
MEMTTMTDFSDMAGNGHIYIKAYSADGFQIGLTLPALTVADAMRHLEDARAAGLLTMMPEAMARRYRAGHRLLFQRRQVQVGDAVSG